MTRSQDDIAQAIVDLINSRPRTPTRAEIATVIGEVLATPDAATQKLRVEWDGLVAQARAASAKLRAVRGASDESELLANDARLDDCARRIFADAAGRPVRSQAALSLVADAAFWVLYDAHLAGGPETDALLATGIWASWEGLRDQALVGLFRAARDIAT